jgi:hypothetical protein
MNVILMCPRCKERTVVSFEDYCYTLIPGNDRMRCAKPLCDKNVLVYHKDVLW